MNVYIKVNFRRNEKKKFNKFYNSRKKKDHSFLLKPINSIHFSLPDLVKPQIVQVMLNVREDVSGNLSRHINPMSVFEN